MYLYIHCILYVYPYIKVLAAYIASQGRLFFSS
jgi:hypothetical protein